VASLLRVVPCLFAKGFPRFPYDTNFISKFETYISNFEMLVSAAEILISRAEMKHGTRGRKISEEREMKREAMRTKRGGL